MIPHVLTGLPRKTRIRQGQGRQARPRSGPRERIDSRGPWVSPQVGRAGKGAMGIPRLHLRGRMSVQEAGRFPTAAERSHRVSPVIPWFRPPRMRLSLHHARNASGECRGDGRARRAANRPRAQQARGLAQAASGDTPSSSGRPECRAMRWNSLSGSTKKLISPPLTGSGRGSK